MRFISVPVLLLLCLFHVQSLSYLKKLTCKRIEKCDQSLTNSTFRFLNSPNPFEFFKEISKLKTKNKLGNNAYSCNSSLRGSSCHDERKVKSSRFYSDTNVAYDKSNVQCGEVLNSPNGVVTSPNYPNPFNVSGECLWTIKTSDGSRLVVNLIDLELDSSINCTQNVLIIYDGPTDQHSQLLVACNQKQLADSLITSRGNDLTIRLITNGTTNYSKGFKFSYETDCNNFIEGTGGSIESPVYQNSKSLNCSWTIKVPKGNNISLVIEKFKSADSSCSSSYLSFIGNQSTKTFCQSADYTDFDAILIAENEVQVNFVNLNPDNQSYFRLEWKLIGCGGDIYESKGELVSPNYPDSYPNGLNCLWTIHGKPGQKIEIYIYEYHIERNDSLKIFDGPNSRSHRLLNLSGRFYAPLQFSTIRNEATIFFEVDENFNGKGFRLYYKVVKSNRCESSYRTIKGSIASPSYPNRFDGLSSCQWTLVNYETHFSVIIEDLDIPWSINCTDYYLRFLTPQQTELARFCGNSFPAYPIRYNSSHTILIDYHSKSYHTGRGFKVNYLIDCLFSSYITSTTYTNLHYPAIKSDSSSCFYHYNIFEPHQSAGLTFYFDFVDLAIKSNSGSYLEIEEKTSNGSAQRVRYHDSSLPLPRIYGAPFHIHTKGDVIFKVEYPRNLNNCSFNLNSWEGAMSSPGYPNDYPPSQTCTWKINLAPGNLISLKFHSFDIQYDQFCALDHLEIREENESGKLIGRFCGSNLPQFNSTQYYPSLWIRFKSHANGSASGFKASYKTISDVKINSDSGKIGSFAYPRLFSSENNQSWIIKTSDSNKIKFKLETIDILDDSFDGSCTNSSVTIYDGPSVNSSILGQFCGYRAGDNPIYTTSSIAYVHFKPNFHISRFLLSWTSVSENIPVPLIDDPNHLCKYTANLKLNQNLTLLSSSYPHDVSCSWTISSPIGTRLQVEINEMDIKLKSDDEKCTKNRVSFFDYSFDHQKLWKINRIVCDEKEKLFTLQGNQSLISFFNYGGSSTKLKGFNITMRPICGGTFYGPTGNIDSSLLGPFETCSWKISVPKGQKVELKFKSFNLGSSDNHCSNGYLSIRNDDSPNSRFIGHYCGSNLPSKIISNSNKLFISTYVPVSEQFEFSFSYRQVSIPCEFHVELNETNPSTIIHLPGYPNPPVEYSECDWVIKAPTDRIIRIDFEIPDHDKKCDLNTTHVDIYDGPSQLLPKLGRFCPIARTTSVVTSDNRMFIHFVTNGGTGSSSFKATVNLHVCGGNIVINVYTPIKSPSYPEPYDSNLTCYYNIYSDKISELLTYELESFDLPSNDNCTVGDYLAIHEYNQSGNLLAKVCGTKVPERDIIHPQTNQLFMVFRSDSKIAGKGFATVFNFDTEVDCNVYVTDDTGVIRSSRFPNIYPGPRNCTYIFMETPDNRISLNFTHYNLKSADSLCRNKLQIDHNPNILMDSKDYFKLEMTPKNITLPCESKSTNYVIESPNNVLIVYFETYSGLESGQGFRAEYSKEKATECGGRIDSISPSIISTNFSQPIDDSRISCAWYIGSEIDTVGTPWISFEKIEVLGSAENDSICSDGKITLGIPKASFYHHMISIENLEFCGNSSKVVTAISPISIAYFSLLTATFNRTRGYRGFEATYHISKCGGTLKTKESNITSPGWPNENYPTDIVCVWSFGVLEETNPVVELVFEEFELEADCSKDYVEIYESNSKKTTKIGRYCSKDKPPFIQAHNGISIVFRSDGDTTSKGFSLNIKSIKNENYIPSCFDYKEHLPGPNYPNPYKSNQHCEEILEVDSMYPLNLTFVNRFEIEDSVNCSKDYLDINEWRNNSWHHFGRYCGYNSPGSIIFKENKAKLIFHSDGDDRRGDGFDYIVTKYCRLTIDKRGNGTIQSFPDSDGVDNCEWTFKGQEPDDVVNVQFEFCRLGDYPRCEQSHIDIYTKNQSTGIDLVERYCNGNEPKFINSQGHLKIVLNSLEYSFSKGVKFYYQIISANSSSSF